MDPSRLRPPSAPAVSTSGGHYTGGGTCFAGSTPPNNGPGSVKVNSPANPIVATFTWQATISTDLPPPAVIVQQDCTASWTQDTVTNDGSATGTVDCGLPGPPPTVTTDSNGKVIGVSSSGTKYSSVSSPGTSFSVPAQSDGQYKPSATFSANAGTKGAASGGAKVDYQVQAFPVTIGLPGTTLNTSDGSLHIQIGQQCPANLNGIPSGCIPSNLQWTATGNTLQGWTLASAGGPVGKANPYTETQITLASPGPVWFWSDNSGSKTVTCSATVTPPTGQGAAFDVTTTQNVTLDVPTWAENDSANPTRIDSLYPQVTGPALWAGGDAAHQNGSQWNDSVTSPGTPYTSNGDWSHLQIATINGTHDTTPVPNNGLTGLDGSFPYRTDGNDYAANGTVVMDDGDSPGINLLDTYTTYNLNYSFDLYVMYIAPGNSSIWVPLTKTTWTWGPNVTRPASVSQWSKWPTGTAPGGNLMVPGSGSRCIDEPTWVRIISEH